MEMNLTGTITLWTRFGSSSRSAIISQVGSSPRCRDKDYIIAQYDGALAYMDSCIANIFASIEELGIEEETLVVIDADHGETLYDHDCFFDHHGIYEPTLHVPLVFRYPGRVPAGARFSDYCQLKDVMPTILESYGDSD